MGSPDSPPPLPAARVSALIDDDGRPRLDSETLRLRDLPAMALDIKFFGYELARLAAQGLPSRSDLAPRHVGLTSKPSTQSDLESDWAAYWCNELKIPVNFTGKSGSSSSFSRLFQSTGLSLRIDVASASDAVRSRFRAISPTLAYMFSPPTWRRKSRKTGLDGTRAAHLVARYGLQALSDQPRSLRSPCQPSLRRHERDSGGPYRVRFLLVDLRARASRLDPPGLDFIENSVATLRPGGVAVHTTEFNFLNDEETVDNWPTVLFQRKHFRELADRLTAAGHHVAPLNFDVGRGVLDKFIDIPPYEHDWTPEMIRQWGGNAQHLKLNIDGFASTCFGLIIRRGGA